MILLDEDSYYKLVEPLKKVIINNLFARSVIEHHIKGEVYVDDLLDPQTFLVVHPYGMSLLFGDWNNQLFNNSLNDYALNKQQTRIKNEWMQAFPNNWDAVLKQLFAEQLITAQRNRAKTEVGIIELNTRVNFTFHEDKYVEFKKKHIAKGMHIVRTGVKEYNQMKGSVVPEYFWNSAEDFGKNGIGFSLMHENNLASTAYSAFIIENQLEIGIETVQEYRCKGYARDTCIALIDYCLDNHYEPIWACRYENVASYKLAKQLGFTPSAYIPFYKLSK